MKNTENTGKHNLVKIKLNLIRQVFGLIQFNLTIKKKKNEFGNKTGFMGPYNNFLGGNTNI